jgi:hypothetical protein
VSFFLTMVLALVPVRGGTDCPSSAAIESELTPLVPDVEPSQDVLEFRLTVLAQGIRLQWVRGDVGPWKFAPSIRSDGP